MATTKTTKKTEEPIESEDFIDVSQFFSKDNEENGMWYEAKVSGVPTGIEFLVYGPNSTATWKSSEKYNKGMELLENIEDEEVRRNKENELLVKSVTERVADVRGKDGKLLKINGKVRGKEDIEFIFINSPAIALSVWNFSQRTDNFLEMKKKN